jgi:cysteine desulfurase
MPYLDHASATPMEPDARDAMLAAGADAWGNPESAHREGRRARAALERAAIEVAEFLGCPPVELRLRPSATEAITSVLEFVLARNQGLVVTTAMEHACIDERLRAAERARHRVRWIDAPAGDLPRPWPGLADDASVLVLSALNHELGTAPDLRAWQDATPQATMIVDGVQAASWLELAPLLDARTLVVISSRKLGGPDGVAALRIPPALLDAWDRSAPPVRVAVSAAAGFAAACSVRRGRRPAALARARELGRSLRDGLLAASPSVLDDAGHSWLGPIVNIAVQGCESRSLDAELDLRGVSVARASACRRRIEFGSRVVAHAHPAEPWRSRSCLRFSLGWSTTATEIDAALIEFRALLDGEPSAFESPAPGGLFA